MEQPDFLAGRHCWYATSHARPTYCNVCREALSGVTSYGLSCEICKYKVHKRCASKTINNCKWTTLASIGKDIIEDQDGNIQMPHQWVEGNLPVSAKCVVCDKNCGSVLKLLDWRCLWCRYTIHTACRPSLAAECQLGPARVSLVPPTALHCIQDEAWDAVRPQASSPLLVFVNSKSGDNQGVKFLRRFKQLLNPAQVFDLVPAGPRTGLRLFRHFDMFRILICSGDGSVGWVLSEVDRLDMHKQCQVAVLPLGTGNDLARVLGWGASCDDDTHLPQLLERYERASTKMLDRWSIMTFERTFANEQFARDAVVTNIAHYEDNVTSHLDSIMQSADMVNSVAHLCGSVKGFTQQLAACMVTCNDSTMAEKCENLNEKLDLLLEILDEKTPMDGKIDNSNLSDAEKVEIKNSVHLKEEKEMRNLKELHRTKALEEDVLLLRVNSLKQAIRSLVEHTEKLIDEQYTIESNQLVDRQQKITANNDTLKIPAPPKSTSNLDISQCPTPLSGISSRSESMNSRYNLTSISPMPTICRDSVCHYDQDNLLTLPVPRQFADSRRSSEIKESGLHLVDEINKVVENLSINKIHKDDSTLSIHSTRTPSEPTDTIIAKESIKHADLAECETDALSIGSTGDISEQFNQSDHIGHIDSPETDTFPNSEALHGESIVEDISSVLEYDTYLGLYDQRSIDTTYDDTTILTDSQNKECGFENPFLQQQIYYHNKRDARMDANEPIKYCSLAQFVEGNDIARKSFRNSLYRKTRAERTAKAREQFVATPQFNCVVEPPSPKMHEPSANVSTGSDADLSIKTSLFSSNYLYPYDNSVTSSNFHLPGADAGEERFLKGSPAATRRISCGSLFKVGEAAAFAAGHDTLEKVAKGNGKKLPIINPLVALPSWPNVSGGTGFIEKCLLANADALCAAVGPLMDPDETLSEGFVEKCVMNNYFGIGIDAKISLDFHNKREEHPEKCRSRAKNYMWYGVLGSKQWLQRTCRNLEQKVQLECDGQRIPLPSLQGIVVLNIPSFMGGINFWGGNKQDDIFLAPSFDDKILEVVAVFGSVQMAASRLINLQQHRIAQCTNIQINILANEGVPIEVDGEAWVQPPGIIRIIHKNRMPVLCRNRALESSLRAWEEKQKHSNYNLYEKRRSSWGRTATAHLTSFTERIRQHSFSGQTPTGTPDKANLLSQYLSNEDLTQDEHNILLELIDCTANLVKWTKILAISNPNIDVDLYQLAQKAHNSLEALYPQGKMLEADILRSSLIHVVESVTLLFDETCCLLRDRGHNLKLRDDLDSKLSVSLGNVEMALKKCTIISTTRGNLVYLQQTTTQNDKKSKKGLFWLKFRGKSSISGQSQPVGSWGTEEVSLWLETLQLSEYVDSFTKNDIRGRELLTLARRDLKDLGVTKVGHVKRILLAVKDLNE